MCAPTGTRTQDPSIKSAVLYQLSYKRIGKGLNNSTNALPSRLEHCSFSHIFTELIVRDRGFEPLQTESKSVVLTVTPIPKILMFIFVIWWITNIIITSYLCLIFSIWKSLSLRLFFSQQTLPQFYSASSRELPANNV